jgi:poly(A) polymerase
MDSLNLATEIVKQLTRHGYIAYFAGGWVRDFIMGYPSADIDIATNAPTEKILDLFPRTVLVGLAFGVVIVVIEGHQFEVSTFRKDLGYEDGRKPLQIELSHPEEDAKRRDFTINGMFYDPLEQRVIDYVGGLEDIKKGVIRTIGDPDERFMEDRLRMIRAVRFAARFGFTIDPATQNGIMMNADTLFPAVAMERIWQEFNKMAAFPRLDHALMELHALKLLSVIFPILGKLHLADLKHQVSSFSHFPKNCPTILYLMELFPHLSLEDQIDLCIYLKISRRDTDLAAFTFRLREKINQEMLRIGNEDLVEWAYLYAHPSYSLSFEVVTARQPHGQRQELLDYHHHRYGLLSKHIERIQTNKPLVSAAVLTKHGILPGKRMGKLIKEGEKISIVKNLDEVDPIINLLQKTSIWLEK